LSNETDVLQAIRLHLSFNPDILLFRNNVGALKDRDGRLIKYGLSPGSSDLIGFMRRSGVAIFLAIEVKAPGAYTDPKRLAAQTNFIRIIKEAGGIAGFASSVQEAEEIINAI